MANPTFYINENELYEQAVSVSDAAGYFQQSYTVEFDSSTIKVKSNMESAYKESESARNLFGELLLSEAENMSRIGNEFIQYDEMLSDMIAAGLVKG